MPHLAIAAAVIGGVTSVAGAAINANASKNAAKTQAAAAERAAAYQAQTAKDIQAYNQKTMSPYMNLGQYGMGLLTGPGQSAAAGPAFAPMPQQGPPQQAALPPQIPVNAPRALNTYGAGYWG